jgi:hypothetical protein
MAQADYRLVKLSQDDERRIGKLAGYLSLAAKIGEKYEKARSSKSSRGWRPGHTPSVK